jgi:pyruvate dehydrogenase E1 component
MKRLGEIVDGEYQTMKAKNGAYVRKIVFNTPELEALVADWSDEDVWNLNRGGHDPHKVYAAFYAAANHKNQPTVILAKTIKGYGMGGSGQGMNIAHQAKKMNIEDIKAFRDQFKIPVPDDKLEELPLVKFEEGSPELNWVAIYLNVEPKRKAWKFQSLKYLPHYLRPLLRVVKFQPPWLLFVC